MPLQIACPSCSRKLKVADEQRGKRVKCPCGKILAVGSPSASPPPPKSKNPRVITCDCGSKLKVPASAAGKQVKCPTCQKLLSIGRADTESPAPVRAAQTTSPVAPDPFATPANDPFSTQANDPFAAVPAPSGGAAPGANPWDDLPSVPTGTSSGPTAAYPAAAATFPSSPAPTQAPSPVNRDNAALAAAGGYSQSVEERQVATGGRDGGFEFTRIHLAIILMFFIGPTMCFFGYREKMRHDRIESTGTATVGMVTDGWEERGRKGRRSYYLDVSWTSESGTQYEETFSVSGSYYGEVALGMPIPCKYDKEDPSELILLDDKDNSMVTVYIGGALFLASIAGIAWVVFTEVL